MIVSAVVLALADAQQALFQRVHLIMKLIQILALIVVLVQEHALQVLFQKANVTISCWPQKLDSNRTVGPAYGKLGAAVFSVESGFPVL